MAEQQDEAQKTEEPTQKRIEDALKKGDVARSQELRHWFMLVAATVVLMTMGAWALGNVKDVLGQIIERSHDFSASDAGLVAYVVDILWQVAGALFLPLLVLFIAGLTGAMVQHPPIFTTEKLKPKLSKLSPLEGFKRIFSPNSLMEFAKTLAKFVIVGGVSFAILWPRRDELVEVIGLPIADVMDIIQSVSLAILMGVVFTMTAIAVLDVVFQRAQHTKKMRMTKQEIKDEHKQLEGDPHVKARIRQIRAERSRRRMMAAVPEADVVITNPTHFSVALQYDYDTMAVPKLTAKGVDFMAHKIREVAEEHDVPLIENPPLARALYATVEVDEDVPAEHYKAVAEVISYIMRLKKKTIAL